MRYKSVMLNLDDDGTEAKKYLMLKYANPSSHPTRSRNIETGIKRTGNAVHRERTRNVPNKRH